MAQFKFTIILLSSIILLHHTFAVSALTPASGNTTHYANETMSSKEGISNRKERLNVLGGLSNGLLGMLGGGGGGSSSGSSGSSSGSSSSSLSTVQQGLKGIQSIQKLVARYGFFNYSTILKDGNNESAKKIS